MTATADDPRLVQAAVGPDNRASARSPAGELPPSTILDGHYSLDVRLGSGALSTTYRATDLRAGRVVAVKVFSVSSGADPMFRERFLKKARAAAALVHPNVAAVYDAGVADGRPYLVMEYVDGQSLRTLLELRGRLTVRSAINLVAHIADAVSCAHGQGIFHADLRPENVLLARQGMPKVVDFGISDVAVATGVVAIDTIERRAAYLAPEQVRGDSIGPRTDVYALAVMLYELLAGAPPLSGSNALATASRRLFAEPPRLRAERPDVSWGLEYVIRQALAPDPADRYPSVQVFRAALLAPPTEDERVTAPPPRTPRARKRMGWLGPQLAVTLPLVATLVLVVTLTGLLDFLPPIFAPFQTVQVPDMRNRTLAEAEIVARGSGLEAVKARPEPCDQYSRDYVIRQEPDPGAMARRGAKVRLTACSGLRVPSLVGQTEEQARIALVQRGWSVSEVRTAVTPDAPAGTIVSQEPAAGLILPDKQSLVLTVAQAPR
jgi:serine/threonine-protein kinase